VSLCVCVGNAPRQRDVYVCARLTTYTHHTSPAHTIDAHTYGIRIRICIHARTLTHEHSDTLCAAQVNRHPSAHVHAHVHPNNNNTHTHTLSLSLIHSLTHTNASTHAHSRNRTHPRTHNEHTHAHRQKCAHTHTQLMEHLPEWTAVTAWDGFSFVQLITTYTLDE